MNTYSASPLSTMEMSAVSHMNNVCDVLNQLQRITKPKISYIKGVKLMDTQYFPLSFLPIVMDDQIAEIQTYHKRGLTFDDLKKKGIVKIVDKSSHTIEFDFDSDTLTINEITRGDFTGDGYNSILVTMYMHSNEGTLANTNTAIITRKSPHGLFEFLWKSPSE